MLDDFGDGDGRGSVRSDKRKYHQFFIEENNIYSVTKKKNQFRSRSVFSMLYLETHTAG